MPKPIKIAACQLDIIPGRPDVNTANMLEKIHEARNKGDEMVIFPEMAVPGYLIGDDWENEAFVRDCGVKNDLIIAASEGIVVIWGNIDVDENLHGEDGRIRKYNSAFVACNKSLKGVIHKTLLPDYREFDDNRYFYSFLKETREKNLSLEVALQPIKIDIHDEKLKLGVSLCEDMWSDDYLVSPVEVLIDNGADCIINLSSSPWTWRKNDKRHRVVKSRLSKKPVPLVYVNNTGIQNNGKNIFLFDGNTTIYHPDASIQKMANDYAEETIRATLFGADKTTIPEGELSRERDTIELLNGLVYGIRKFFRQSGFEKVVIGLSGGIDSSLVAALMTEALGPGKVFGINMPSRYNSETTKGLAHELAVNLGINYTIVPIQQSVEHTNKQVSRAVFTRMDGSEVQTGLILSPLNKENIQARDRGSRVLAAIASALGAVFTNNGNKTELALGYATLYGDINGAIAPIADLYKTEVYQLAKFINREKELIPRGIINLVPSAELSEEQNVDEGKGDPIIYPYHDQLLRAFIVFRKDPEDILAWYLQGIEKLENELKCQAGIIKKSFTDGKAFVEDLEKTWKTYRINYFKRIQSPPIIAVSKRAFGFDLRESQLPVYFTDRYHQLKEKLLGAV